MSTRKGGWGPYEFTRAASDEVHLSQQSFRVVWAIALLPGKRPGVWFWTAQVVDAAGESDPSIVVRYQAEWPNSKAQTFEAFLYSCCFAVARCVESWAVSEGAERERARQA
jgi:hypothetical protein